MRLLLVTAAVAGCLWLALGRTRAPERPAVTAGNPVPPAPSPARRADLRGLRAQLAASTRPAEPDPIDGFVEELDANEFNEEIEIIPRTEAEYGPAEPALVGNEIIEL